MKVQQAINQLLAVKTSSLKMVTRLCMWFTKQWLCKIFFITYHCRCWRCWSWWFWRSLQGIHKEISILFSCNEILFLEIYWMHTQKCTCSIITNQNNLHLKRVDTCRLVCQPTWDSSLEAWTGGVQVVEGLPSCDPGWGGGQSLVVGVLTVEVELVVTVLLLVVELGGVGDCNDFS